MEVSYLVVTIEPARLTKFISQQGNKSGEKIRRLKNVWFLFFTNPHYHDISTSLQHLLGLQIHS